MSEQYVTFGSKNIFLSNKITPQDWLTGTQLVCDSTGDMILWDFTGGEPTLYEHFPELLNLVKPYSIWAVTSNSLLRKQIDKLDFERCCSWTASWHPGANKPIDQFIDNIKFVQSHKIYTSVTIVLHESTKLVIKDDLKRLQDAGFPTQIHLFLSEGWSLNDASQELKDVYEDLKQMNKAPAEGWSGSAPGLLNPRDCIAGYKSATVSSDGFVYSCYRHLMVENAPPIGRWGTWKPSNDLTRDCTWDCNFACDLRNTIGTQYYDAP